MTKPNDAAIGCMARAEKIVNDLIDKTMPEVTTCLSRILAGLKSHDLITTLRAVEEFNETTTKLAQGMNSAGRAMRAIRDVDPDFDEAHREEMLKMEHDVNARRYLEATPHDKQTKDLAEMKEHVARCTDAGCQVNELYAAIQRELARRANTAAGSAN